MTNDARGQGRGPRDFIIHGWSFGSSGIALVGQGGVYAICVVVGAAPDTGVRVAA